MRVPSRRRPREARTETRQMERRRPDGTPLPVEGLGALVAEGFEAGPAGVAVLLFVLVRLVVQVLAADVAESRAVGTAEDLLPQGKRDRVARPARPVEHVALDVLRGHLLVFGLLVLVLARMDRQLEDGVPKAAVARPEEPGGERQREHRPGVRTRDLERRRHLLRHREIP